MNSDLYTLASFIDSVDGDVFAKALPFQQYHDDYQAKGYLTYRRIATTGPDTTVRVYDPEAGREREFVMFGSNNYLGLATHPKVIEAAVEATRRYGAGSGGASLLCGTSRLHRELEERIAAFEGFEDALVFPSGYAANLGAIAALARKGETILFDKLVHASMIDGVRLSEADAHAFRHNGVAHLETLLTQRVRGPGGKLIVVDGVYSMDGDIPPLPQIVELAKRHGARVLVDEAHATGVMGPTGRGTVEHFGLGGKVDLVMGTFSKALGSQGGFLASSREVVNYLRYYSRAYFFSTSPPPAQAAAALAALELIDAERWRLERLWDNVSFLRGKLRDLGFDCLESRSAIVPVVTADELATRRIGKRLHELGVYANPILYPAVPRRKPRIRLSVMSSHTRADLDRAIEALETAGREFGVL